MENDQHECFLGKVYDVVTLLNEQRQSRVGAADGVICLKGRFSVPGMQAMICDSQSLIFGSNARQCTPPYANVSTKQNKRRNVTQARL